MEAPRSDSRTRPSLGTIGVRPVRDLTFVAALGGPIVLVLAAAVGIVSLGPPHAGWILWPSGVLSSVGAETVRTAVLAVVVSWLVVERRAWAAGFVLASVMLVHVADRAGKLFFSELRPRDPQAGWALSRPEVLVVLVVVLLGGLVLLAGRPGSIWWALPASYAVATGVDRLARLIPVGPGVDSFPSGHASNTMALALALTIVLVDGRSPHARPVAVAAIGSAVLVGVSRLTLGFHNPADVLGGWVTAGVVTFGLRLLLGPERLARSASSSPVAERVS